MIITKIADFARLNEALNEMCAPQHHPAIEHLLDLFAQKNGPDEELRVAYDQPLFVTMLNGTQKQVTEVDHEGVQTFITMERQMYYSWNQIHAASIVALANALIAREGLEA